MYTGILWLLSFNFMDFLENNLINIWIGNSPSNYFIKNLLMTLIV